MKIMTIIGTRPEVIKMAPVIRSLKDYPENFESVVCVTAQHREMLDQTLKIFNIVPDYDLNVMIPNQSLSLLTANILIALDKLIASVKPDWILVQGDTTTVFVASLVAYYHRIKLGHVEAGLRSYDKFQPYPEEVNRRVSDILADAYFAPTENSRINLLKEGARPESIIVTGNTVVDALKMMKQQIREKTVDNHFDAFANKLLILVTIHRRENFGEPLKDICDALARIAASYQNKVQIVYPVHLNPNVRNIVYKRLKGYSNISLIDPVNYEELVGLMSRAYMVMTDSGGIQEEAPSLNKPVLVLRNLTERPEAVETGAAKLIGTNADSIFTEAQELIENVDIYNQMANAPNPFGDGRAGERIVQFLLDHQSN